MVLEEVMFDGPHVVDAQPVGELHMLQGLAEHPLLVALLPAWPYSSGWGYYPSGGFGLLLVVVVLLLLLGGRRV